MYLTSTPLGDWKPSMSMRQNLDDLKGADHDIVADLGIDIDLRAHTDFCAR